LLGAIHFELVNPARRSVAFKDAPTVAAARQARVQALVTFDEKHLLRNIAAASYIRAPVIWPRQAVVMAMTGKK
jgi:hypothetical protein